MPFWMRGVTIWERSSRTALISTPTHSSGYGLNPPIGNSDIGFQHRVSSFDTVDVFLQYDVNGTSVFDKDLAVTLNVTNLFDKNPPYYNQDPGFTNGFTLGRFIQIGVRKGL